ncbi:pentapeptide repeat-containing protein [Baaleninema simplex]|uniref:pentapeptide repeat-containing protein n=1 Tax=Baaleninema simplex TaxID=2862350 RepID=UPI00037C358D|nr:pentapeptide repeat-containing protein [Baaleninema simplex]
MDVKEFLKQWDSGKKDFDGIYLREVDLFEEAIQLNVSRPILHWATGISFRNAKLLGVNFSRSDLSNADFENANLKGSIFAPCRLQGAIFSNANLSQACLSQSILNGASFIGANLEGANLESCQLENVDFYGTNLKNANLRDTNLNKAVNLQYAILDNTIFGCLHDIRRSDIYHAKSKTIKQGNSSPKDRAKRLLREYQGGKRDFSKSNLIGVSLIDVNLENIILNSALRSLG